MYNGLSNPLVGKKVLVVYLFFGCCFALAVFLFRFWKRHSMHAKLRNYSYADRLAYRFSRNRKKAMQKAKKKKSRSSKR